MSGFSIAGATIPLPIRVPPYKDSFRGPLVLDGILYSMGCIYFMLSTTPTQTVTIFLNTLQGELLGLRSLSLGTLRDSSTGYLISEASMPSNILSATLDATYTIVDSVSTAITVSLTVPLTGVIGISTYLQIDYLDFTAHRIPIYIDVPALNIGSAFLLSKVCHFPDTVVGESSIRQIHIRNESTTPLFLLDCTATLTKAVSEFSLNISLPFIIPASSTVSIDALFSPKENSLRSAQFNFTTNCAGLLSCGLFGKGLNLDGLSTSISTPIMQPLHMALHNRLDAPIIIGSAITQTYTIENQNSFPVYITDIYTESPALFSFPDYSTIVGSFLNSHEIKQVQVIYTPQEETLSYANILYSFSPA